MLTEHPVKRASACWSPHRHVGFRKRRRPWGVAGDEISYLGDDEQPLCKLDYSSKICRILVPRGLASFGQHQESRPLGWSNTRRKSGPARGRDFWYWSEGARPQETRMDLSHFILKKMSMFLSFWCDIQNVFNVLSTSPVGFKMSLVQLSAKTFTCWKMTS